MDTPKTETSPEVPKEDTSPDEVATGDLDDAPSGWSRFLSAVGRAAGATGRGFASLYRMSASNAHFLRPVLNGFLGDQIAAEGQGIRMSFRVGGHSVEPADLDLDRRLVGPGRTVVVMVHGLMCDEVIFHDTRIQPTAPERPGHGVRLQQELGATVLYLRYNSGLHISENGRALSELLQRLVACAGDRLDRLVLVGHSMGGLVVRSAGYYATENGQDWIERLRAAVLIGSPQHGSYVEQLANLSAFVLHRIPNLYTKLSGAIVDQRSNGIKDLRFGLMAEQDWRDRPYDDRLYVERTVIPPLPGVDYHVLASTLLEDEASPVARYFGDGLMSQLSAKGEALVSTDDPLCSHGSYRVFSDTGHFDILVNPEVGDYVVDMVRRSLDR